MFAKRIGGSVRQTLNHTVAVNHSLIKRSWFNHQSGEHDTLLHTFGSPGAYAAAVIDNQEDFMDRVVLDVGAGVGYLSLVAAKAGARHVYAVEASLMAENAREFVAANPSLSERITVIMGKMEDIELPEKADILISKLLGTTLVSKKKIKDYVIARDRFLNPNGKMFPSIGRIHMAPFTDEHLFNEKDDKEIADKIVVDVYDPN